MLHIDGRPAVEKPLIEPTLPFLFEQWKNLIFDTALWVRNTTNSGTAVVVQEAARGSNVAQLSTGADVSAAMIYGRDDWQARSGNAAPEVTGYDNTGAVRYTVLDFECQLTNVPAIDNGVFFMGFVAAHYATRVSQDIIGFILVGDALYTITDIGGVETITAVPGGPDLDDQLYHYRIFLMQNQVIFMHNHSIATIHTTNIPNDPMFPGFVIQNDVEEDAIMEITNISIGYRRYPSQILVS